MERFFTGKFWEANTEFYFLLRPPHPPQLSHCGVAKFIPNLIALRQWKQCGIIYCLSSLTCQGGAKTQRPYNRIVSTIVSDGTHIFEPCYFKHWICKGHMRSIFIIGKLLVHISLRLNQHTFRFILSLRQFDKQRVFLITSRLGFDCHRKIYFIVNEGQNKFSESL